MRKRMRLPNGFGQISEIKNKRLRNPFRVMVTVGTNELGKPICKLLKPKAYFKTYNEAYQALMEYNKDPYSLDTCMTMDEIYSIWIEKYKKTVKSDSSLRTVYSAWNNSSSLHGYKVREIKSRHIKECISEAKTPNIKARIKSLYNLLFDYAVEYELTDKNYARMFSLSKDIVEDKEQKRKEHVAFTDEEMNILWRNVDNTPFVNVMLIQCYTGFRPGELGNLLKENIDLDNKYIIGGGKTKAGTNRRVPIHEKIEKLVLNLYESSGSEYLIECNGKMTYDKYRRKFENIIKVLGLNPNHRCHDPRKHFVTMAKKYNLDEYAIKRIVGHEISDITEAIYTSRPADWLYQEIQKIEADDK